MSRACVNTADSIAGRIKSGDRGSLITLTLDNIEGMNVLEGSVLGFRNTNRRIISLVPCNNEFEVSGGTFSNITDNFKYYYRLELI